MQTYGQSSICTFVWVFYHNNRSVIGKEYPMFQKPSGSSWGGSVHQEVTEQHQNVFTVPLQIFTINQALRTSRMTHTLGKMWRMLYQQTCSRCTRNVPQFGTSQNTATGWRSPIGKGSLQASYLRTACRSAVPWPCFSVGGQCDRACCGAAENGSILQRAALNGEGGKKEVWQCRCTCDVMERLRRHIFEHQNVDNFKTDTTLEEESGLVDTPHSTRPTAAPLQNRQFQYLSF